MKQIIFSFFLLTVPFVSLKAQLSTYPYPDVLEQLGNPDTLFICRINNCSQLSSNIANITLFIYTRNNNWYSALLERYYCSDARKRKARWKLYRPRQITMLKTQDLVEAYQETKDFKIGFDWSSHHYYVYCKLSDAVIEKEVPGRIAQLQLFMPQTSRLFINTYFEAWAMNRSKKVIARYKERGLLQ